MLRDPRKIVFLPRWLNGNPYLTCLRDALTSTGFLVAVADFPVARLPLLRIVKHHPGFGVIHLHWITPLVKPVYWSDSRYRRCCKFWLLYLCLWVDFGLVKKHGVKVVWTVHNVVDHECRNETWELLLRGLIARHADALCFHSKEARDQVLTLYHLNAHVKSFVAPHACYGDHCGLMAASQRLTARRNLGFDQREFIYLFFGNIRAYKGVDRLLNAFSRLEGKHLRLVISGKVSPNVGENWLSQRASADTRIHFESGFVPEERLGAFLNAADIVVLPYTRTLSSGSALLAITFGKPLILPVAAKVFGVPGEKGAIYFDGADGLKRAMENARRLSLTSYQDHNRALSNQLTWENMATILAAVYRA